MKTYSEKLKDPRWQRKRLEVMERDGFACADCGDEKSQLAVHHTYYVSGRSPWKYPNWSLTTLCNQCHKDKHDKVEENEEDTSEVPTEWEAVIGFLGIEKIADFGEDWWDISTMLAMRKDEFKERQIRPIDWMMWAYLELSAKEHMEKTGEENPLR